MDTTPRKSKTVWIVAIIVGAVLLLVVGIIAALAVNNAQPEGSSSNTSTSGQAADAVATETEVKRNLDSLDRNMEELKTGQEAAKASLDDGKKQIKVGN